MSRVNVNPNNKTDNSDVLTLTDIDTQKSVALITTDSEGNFNWRGITRAPLVRNAMQTSTSSNKYSDLELPWISIADEDWSGGRGQLLFNEDTTRFYDSKRAQTAFKGIFNAPLEFYTDIKDASTNCPKSLRWINIRRTDGFLYSQPVTASGTWDAREVYLHLRRRGHPTGYINVILSATQTPDLSDEWFRIDCTEFPDTLSEFMKHKLSNDVTMSSTMFLIIETSNLNCDDNNALQIGVTSMDEDAVNPCTMYNNGTWEVQNFELLYRIAPEQDDIYTKFFTYQQLTFCVRNEPNDVAKLYINGTIGKVDAASSTTIVDNGRQWNTDKWKGAKLGLVYGYGIEDDRTVWHNIAGNTYDDVGDTDTITIEEEFGFTPTNTTVYIINNTPVWTELNAGLTSHVTDIEVIRDNVFICQGDHDHVIRMHWDYTTDDFVFTTLSWNAVYLKSVRDTEGLMLWRGQNDDDNHRRSISMVRLIDRLASQTQICNQTTAVTTTNGSVATASVDYGHQDLDCCLYKMVIETFTSDKNLGKFLATLQGSDDDSSWVDVKSFDTVTSAGTYYMYASCPYRYRRMFLTTTGTNGSVNKITVTSEIDNVFKADHTITLLDNYGKMTGLFEYGADTDKNLWVMQEGMLSSVNKYTAANNSVTYTLDRINIDELVTTSDEWNANTVITSDVYLVFAWLNGVQRYYNTQLEGKGADKDEGLPLGRRGRVTKLLAYPTHFFASVDGGENGTSAVYMFNQSGWHQIYSAPNVGERIRDMEFQPIYGGTPDRLWIAVGDDLVYLAMPSKTLEALKDENALYTHESVVVGAWMNAGMTDIPKLWHSMKIMADFLDGETCWVEADYQVDDEAEWHPVENWYVESPSQKEELNPHGSVNGKKFRYRLRLQTTDKTKTPRVNVVVLEAVGRVDIKYSYSFAVRNIKYKSDLNGEFEDIEPLDIQNLLDEWANEIKKLRLNCRYKVFDDKTVYLDAVQTSVLNELSEGYIVQLTLNEL